MKYIVALILLACLLNVTQADAQYYDIGQAPASYKWEKAASGRFSIIYPDFARLLALKALRDYEIADTAVMSGLNPKIKPLPLILHPESAVSNAYTIWAPRRIEMLSTPPQDIYGQPWTEQLALHEYRHVVQLSALNEGITGFFGILFGQQAAVLATGLFVPPWFLEGDAVVTETALSHTGRGRVPGFSQDLRAQIKEKGIYSFPKATLGSYCDYVPDSYTTGYHIISTTWLDGGNKAWPEAMRWVARKPWSIAPFNAGLRKTTGMNKKGMYYKAFSILDSLWNDRSLYTVNAFGKTCSGHEFASYTHAHIISDSTAVALKTSLSRVPSIVLVQKNGHEKTLHIPGYIPDQCISSNGSSVVWAEYRPHIRWETVNYTNICILNLASGTLNRLPFKGRFYAPAISPDGKRIAAVTYTRNGDCQIAIIKDSSIRYVPVPSQVMASGLSWNATGTLLATILTGEEGKTLALIDVTTQSIRILWSAGYRELSYPQFSGNQIMFTLAAEGKNEIAGYNMDLNRVIQYTRSAYGASYASGKGNTFIYSNYTANGYRLATHILSDTVHQVRSKNEWPLATAISRGRKVIDFTTQDAKPFDYSIQPYKKAGHLINLHSWAPLYIDIGNETVRPGVSLMSQNLLSTLFITAGYDYSLQEQSGTFRTGLTYKGWFPEVSLNLADGIRAGNTIKTGQTAKRYTWHEQTADLSVQQNLNLSKGNYLRGISGSISYSYSVVKHDISTPDDFIEGEFSGFHYRLSCYTYRRQAYRDLAPRLGITASAEFKLSPFGRIDAGNIAALQLQGYLPGIGINHALSFSAGWQKAHEAKYRYGSLLAYSRGYTSEIHENDFVTLKSTYRLPIAYPDWHLAGLLYIKRLRAAGFFDITQTQSSTGNRFYNSAGADLVADFHLFGLSTPISAGLRSTYLIYTRTMVYNLLVNINFYSF